MLVVFGVSRLVFFYAGTLAALFLPWVRAGGNPREPAGFLNYWAHWDGGWYAQIAVECYAPRAPESTVFFPLYPMLVRAGTAIVGGGPALWGVLVSIASSLFAIYFIYRITEELGGTDAARAASLTFAFFPTAFFLNAVYTEALFVALSAGSYWAARVRRDLLLAGVLAALAAATRNFGVLLVIPLGYEYLRNRREFGLRGAVGLLFVLAGLFGYAFYLWVRFGDPLLFLGQQGVHWHRELDNPLRTLGRAWAEAGEGVKHFLQPASFFLERTHIPALEASDTLNLAFLVLLVVLLALCLCFLPPGLSAYAFLVTLLPVLTPSPAFPLMSLPRFALGAFPLFIVLGLLLSRSRPALYAWLSLSGGLGVALTALFVTWRWVA